MDGRVRVEVGVRDQSCRMRPRHADVRGTVFLGKGDVGMNDITAGSVGDRGPLEAVVSGAAG